MEKKTMDNTRVRITPEMIKQSKTLTCDCGGQIFTPGMILKKISALISPSGKEELSPIEVIICSKCGKVPTEYNKEVLHGMLHEEVLAKSVKKEDFTLKKGEFPNG